MKKKSNLWTLLIGALAGWALVTLMAAVLVVAWRLATMAATGLANIFLP
jgi:hypothetical protein